MGSHRAFAMEPVPAAAPNLHLIDGVLSGKQPEQSSVNMNNRSHGGWERMENIAYKADRMVLTTWIGAASEGERNGILNFYIVCTKVKMFLLNPIFFYKFNVSTSLKS